MLGLLCAGLAAAGPPPDDVAPAVSAQASAPPRDVGAMASRVAGDGRWVPVPDDASRGEPVMWKTTLHPDTTRSDAEVFIVAIDISRTRLHAVPGASEPRAAAPPDAGTLPPGDVRAAMIPAADQPALLAAWNGGWKSEHGHYAMQADGVTIALPKDGACTIAGYYDDSVRIGPWRALAESDPYIQFYRQTPACLYVQGTRNPALAAQMTTNWGAAADGNPVIRRSAMGTDARGAFLYVGVSNATTAPALADGMHHAGAADVAELDVNWAFPRFLVFRADAAGKLTAQSLFPGFVFEKDQYVGKRSARDFFYVVRRGVADGNPSIADQRDR